jgi:hypothetical protein
LKYEVGQTYKALLGDGKIHALEVSEIAEDELMWVRWDDEPDREEWFYPEELGRLVQAARDKEEEERYS